MEKKSESKVMWGHITERNAPGNGWQEESRRFMIKVQPIGKKES